METSQDNPDCSRFVKAFQDLLIHLYIIKTFWGTSGSKILTNWEISIEKNDKINSLSMEIKYKLSRLTKNFMSRWISWSWLRLLELEGDEVVLSKTVLPNFCPKQPNESIGGPRASIFELFIAILTWPNPTGLNRPLSPFFHPLTLPGYPLFCCLFSKNWKMEIKRSGVKCLTYPNLACFSGPFSLFFHHLTPPVEESRRIFERTVFERTTYPNWKVVSRQNQDFSIVETSFLKLLRFSQLLRQAFWNCWDRDSWQIKTNPDPHT